MSPQGKYCPKRIVRTYKTPGFKRQLLYMNWGLACLIDAIILLSTLGCFQGDWALRAMGKLMRDVKRFQ